MRLPTWMGLVAGVLMLAYMGPLSNPVEAIAQSPNELARLTIALWPEYDRSEVLVIYQGEVAPETPLPAMVRLDLPAQVQQMHAVAYVDEVTNALITLEDFRLEVTPEGKLLTLTTPARRFHAEYYADDLMSREGASRTIQYVFTAPVTIANFNFEVQQPVGAFDFTSDPAPISTEKRGDGLSYARYPVERLTAGASRSLRVSYQRTTNLLSLEAQRETTESSASPPVPPTTSTGLPLEWGIAFAVSFCLGIGLGYFAHGWRHSRHSKSAPWAGPVKHVPAGNYCYRCGARLYHDALYCHLCGVPRRDVPREETGG
ncbi:MAG: hypothetical protein ACUVSF_12270 [Anaerolineae bacterium]